jgi:CRP/FNR family transcriptional regulator, nitrogen oxide reductase regulator
MDATIPNPVAVTADLLERIELFQGLDSDALAAVVQTAHVHALPSGSCFFLQDDPATRFYVLLQGRVRLTQVTAEGQQVILRFITPGEGMGIVAALGAMVYPASAEALDACRALMWDGAAVAALMERYPRLALNGMRLLAQRVREFQDRLREMATERVERRLARMLLRLARQSGHKVANGILIDLPMSRQNLAEMTGTTLYTVSRILSLWETRGLVEAGRERVLVRNPHGLVVVADDLPEADEPRT